MRNLYIADLKRLLKDKLFMVTCILAGVFSAMSPLLSKAILSFIDVGAEDLSMLGFSMNAKSMMFNSFLPADNLGLIMPILITIIVCKDFGQGTVRNKIISGHSRKKIFFSHLLSAATVICGIMLVHSLLTLIISLCFFPYQAVTFTLADLGYLLISIVFEMLVYLAISAVVVYFAAVTGKTGICILLYLALAIGLSIIGAIFQIALLFMDTSSVSYKVVELLNALNLYSSSIIGTGVSYSAKDVLYILMAPAVMIGGGTLLGLRKFSRKNLK